jgi:subtilase family serine protease
MKILKTNRWVVLCAVALLLVGQAAWAQQVTVPARVVAAVDDTQTVTLRGNVHPLARAANDQGALPDSQPMTRMLLLLQRSDTQEASLRQLLDAQQTKGSGSYHNWLTPEQFGKQYGPADTDVQAVTDWLTRQGFQVANVAAGRTVIEFSGNVGQVRNAFHTQIHKYLVKGEEHFANASDPAIPEALAPVVKGVVALHNFPKHSYIRSAGLYRRTKATGELKPLFTFGSGTSLSYAMGPADFATIYNIPPNVVTGQVNGTGQTIAIVGQSNINTDDIVAFRSMFGLPAYTTVCTSTLPPTCQLSVIVNGTDPGILAPPSQGIASDETESDLDVEWSGAIAPNAQILFVTSQSTQSNPTQVSAGTDLSALYIVDNNLAPVMSESYGECEAYLLTAGNQFYNQLWEQAAAQGITVAIAAGDSGPAGCDPYPNDPDPDAANQGLNVNGTASTPYNVAVGGTDFDPVQVQHPTTYWNSTNTATQESAIGYIPEVPWSDSACALNYPAACTSVNANGADLAAGAGGPSNCIQTTVNNSTGEITCNTSGAFPNGIGYAKPAWQTPPLTPADSVRDLPDVSFFASDGFFSGVADVVCESDQNAGGASCSLNSPFEDFMGVGGTSAATPAFAAVMALVNQKTGERQGNANYVLYGLAAREIFANCNSSKLTSPTSPAPAGCTFYDITKGNNSVACDAGSPNCSNSGSSGYGVMVSTVTVDNGSPAFQAEPGYDLATGLGTINVGNLLANWKNFSRTVPTVTLGSVLQSGQTVTTSAVVSPAPTGTAGTESVSLVALASATGPVLGTIGPFTLTSGTANIPATLLPVGTAYLEASYGGDATLAASTSTPPTPLATTVAGAGYTGKATVYFVGYNSSTGAPNTPTTSSQSFAFGTPYILSILVTDNGTSCAFGYPNTRPTSPTIPCPTGTIKLFDNGNAQNDFLNNGASTNQTSLNNLGLVEDQPINLSATLNGTTPGAHNLTVTYSGDQNYSAVAAGGSNTLSITVSKAATTTLVGTNPSVLTSAGGSVTLGAYITTISNGAGPGGTVQFANGSANIGPALTCQGTASVSGSQDVTPPISQITAGTAYCFVSTTTNIAALYPPGTVRPGPPSVPVVPLAMALVSLLLFVLGLRWVPERGRRAFATVALVAFAALAGTIAGCGGGGGGGGGGGSTVTINVAYSGDSNYSPSNGSAQITVQ